MFSDIPHRRCDDGFDDLTPKPYAGFPRLELFEQIAHKGRIWLAESRQKGRGDRWRRPHAGPPFNCGMPLQRAVNARRVSFTAFRPFEVTLKKRLALPPRSGVGSP